MITSKNAVIVISPLFIIVENVALFTKKHYHPYLESSVLMWVDLFSLVLAHKPHKLQHLTQSVPCAGPLALLAGNFLKLQSSARLSSTNM
jgi:hypothetical protein